MRVTANVELTDKYAALSIVTERIADDDPSLNTAEPLLGTYSNPLTAYNIIKLFKKTAQSIRNR